MRAFFREVSRNVTSAPSPDADFFEWHRWSVREIGTFWSEFWRFANVIAEPRFDGTTWARVLHGGDRMGPPDSGVGPAWFSGARLNFAENLLRGAGDAAALIARDETDRARSLSFAELRDEAGRFARALHGAGVRPGDRVAGYLPNGVEAVVAMLGSAWIGAVWSSCSPDFGTRGVLDRFGQIEPRILVAADGYRYAGKDIDLMPRIVEISSSLPTVERTVVVGSGLAVPALTALRSALSWHDWLASGDGPAPEYARLPFDHPLYIMYSSGTTGLPKCMVHGAGGTLLQHLKEHLLHGDLRAGERIFYFTTCGWMMWNWVVSALAAQAAVVLYDGASLPASNPAALWDVVAEERVAVFGTSAKHLALSEKAGVRPRETHDLSSLRSILSTGSPLAPASFDYVAGEVKPGVQLSSISGGTDLISCFALGNPLLPVWRGELQAPGLGMAVDVFAPDGTPLRGEPGELVCTRPFPSMPVAFWNDPGGAKYREAYFDVFPNVWRHGDWAEITGHGGLVIHGRSDATLNPGGVRIGTAEIYRVVEQFPELVESVVIGGEMQDRGAADVRIVLFVRLRDGSTLSDELADRLKRRIREEASPHHVPKLVLQVADVPRTVSGKITELAVREAFHGRPVRNTSAMANPEALEEYRRLGAGTRGTG
jgi:acetoacetyl-CoA synthetase